METGRQGLGVVRAMSSWDSELERGDKVWAPLLDMSRSSGDTVAPGCPM